MGMFGSKSDAGMIAAINKSQAVIEFTPDGKILGANDNFLKAMGYALDEIKGQHHSMFADPAYKASAEYKAFWEKLGRGEFDAGQYKRLGKGGKEIWIQASYNPVLSGSKVVKVVKFATDITAQKLANANFEGQLAAINKAQAAIEFTLDGKILNANENFLNAMGYTLGEIVGQHHSMFADPAYKASAEYKAFWEKLGRGEFDAGQYRRIAKGGREIWIQASYNPIFDMSGKPFKVVKFATDITAQKMQAADYEGQLAAIDKAQAVISFALDGKILDANENFLKTVGYALDEIKGHHHSMFVEPEYKQSAEYRAFWEKLGRGEYDAGQYKRIGKGGKQIWIQASYNPIMDMNGRPFKVVKFATDITAQMQTEALKLAVKQSQEVIETAKAFNLTKRVPMEGKTGEIGALCGGVNGLVDMMADVIANVKVSAREVASAAIEISTATTDLSLRTEQQAAGLEETSASMEEISATVRKNAENAQQANTLTANTSDVADKGGAVVAKAVEAMSRIEDSSSKIADIIGVIDEIARQTNLLALNAAVEAARAGDAGRGFAVVASEVRSLAQRSSQAAKDIKDLITNSTTQVTEGVVLVNRAGESLNEITASIKNVANIVADIATASKEQATGIDQVNKALTHMDEVTQQNSALVEENAAAAKTLETQSKAMDEQVNKFVVDGTAAAEANVTPMRPSALAAKPATTVRRGPVGRMQSQLATALKTNPDWEEF